MKSRIVHRLRNGLVVSAILATVILLEWQLRDSLRSTTFITGWILFTAMLILASYQFRKTLSFLPLGNTRMWLQFHLYLGLSTSVFVMLHAGWQWPHSIFGGLLYSCYLLLFVSGVSGLALSRIVPSRLTSRGEEVLFERIPVLRYQLFQKVENCVVHGSPGLANSPIAHIYATELIPFFSGSKGWINHLMHSERHRVDMVKQIENAKAFLNIDEIKSADEIVRCIHAKDNLDYQYVWQGLLKLWLFVHIPATYVMLVLMTVHALIVCTFASSHL